MVPALALLLLCQLAGEAVAAVLHLPLPGPVIGMAILLVVLMTARRPAPQLETTSAALLRALSLMLVPPAVGIVDQTGIFAAHGVGLAVALAVSTVVTLLVTLGVFRLAARRIEARGATP